jgi:hypothetical protein
MQLGVVHQDHKDQLDRPAPLARLGQRVRPGRLDLKVYKELKVIPAIRVRPVQLVPKVLKA